MGLCDPTHSYLAYGDATIYVVLVTFIPIYHYHHLLHWPFSILLTIVPTFPTLSFWWSIVDTLPFWWWCWFIPIVVVITIRYLLLFCCWYHLFIVQLFYIHSVDRYSCILLFPFHSFVLFDAQCYILIYSLRPFGICYTLMIYDTFVVTYIPTISVPSFVDVVIHCVPDVRQFCSDITLHFVHSIHSTGDIPHSVLFNSLFPFVTFIRWFYLFVDSVLISPLPFTIYDLMIITFRCTLTGYIWYPTDTLFVTFPRSVLIVVDHVPLSLQFHYRYRALPSHTTVTIHHSFCSFYISLTFVVQCCSTTVL